jgi:hypothetical protein
MITTQSIVTLMEAQLDAEGSDRYLFDQDYRPAINSAKDWIVSIFKHVFADKSVSEESLRDLVFIRVFQTSKFSRINVDKATLGHDIWSILSVNPNARTYPNSTILTPSKDEESLYRTDLTYLDSETFAKRLSVEEWENMKTNIFAAGNQSITNSLRSYGYVSPGNYGSTSYDAGGPEIEISPTLDNKLVGIRYLKYPNDVSLITDNLEFPSSLKEMITKKALNFIAIKQGDGSTLYQITKEDIGVLTQLIL